jgi:hypothetical protein
MRPFSQSLVRVPVSNRAREVKYDTQCGMDPEYRYYRSGDIKSLSRSIEQSASFLLTVLWIIASNLGRSFHEW